MPPPNYLGPDCRGHLELLGGKPFPFKLSRLYDHEFAALAPWLQPIAPISRMVSLTPTAHSLASVYHGAELLFGRSSTRFDPCKGSFAFPLMLTAQRNGQPIRYALRLQDCRGFVRLEFNRLASNRVNDWHGYHDPVEHEIAAHEMLPLSESICSYIYRCGYWLASDCSDFHRIVPEERYIYGCRHGLFFEHEFDQERDYEAAVEQMRLEWGNSEEAAELAYVTEMVEHVSGARTGEQPCSLCSTTVKSPRDQPVAGRPQPSPPPPDLHSAQARRPLGPR